MKTQNKLPQSLSQGCQNNRWQSNPVPAMLANGRPAKESYEKLPDQKPNWVRFKTSDNVEGRVLWVCVCVECNSDVKGVF